MSSKKDSKKTPTNLNYLYQNTKKSVKDGKVEVLEEMVVDGPRGIKINYYKKSDSSVEKIVVFSKGDGFVMKSSDGEKTLSKAELMEELKSNKKLKFAADFAKTQKGGKALGMVGGAKKSSKKTSKKSSKKGSKTMVGSKKPKKSSKKSSKKGSKKASKKSYKK